MASPVPLGDAFQPAACAGAWRPRRSLGVSEGAWPSASPSPSTWRAPRTHPLARFARQGRGGGLRFALPPRWRPRSAQT
eukprot:3521474-Prymnesium_polylepis.1